MIIGFPAKKYGDFDTKLFEIQLLRV